MNDQLGRIYPRLAACLPRMPLAQLPTPLETKRLRLPNGSQIDILVKRDDLSGRLYGGNKVRKLEFLLQRARDRGASRVATFGSVASNHALATTLYAAEQGFDCICFLSHQVKTPKAPAALSLHLHYGTRVVRYGGTRAQRIATLRKHLANRKTWVIPMGGSSWLGAMGFVDAGLEFADQLAANGRHAPERLYVASGTMATAAGLSLGLLLAGLETELHAVRVTDTTISNPAAMRRLIAKTALMMRRLDATIPQDLADRVKLRFRDEFFGKGYAQSDARTDAAVRTARDQLGLELETTYTGKAMAALLQDAQQSQSTEHDWLFWNTYNSQPLPAFPAQPDELARLPRDFLRYFD